MSAQNFLTNQLGRIGKGLERVIAGDDYLDSKSTPGKNYDKFAKDTLKRQVKTPNGLSSLNKSGELVPRQSRLTPEIPKPLNPNASARSRARTPVIKPNQFAAQPTGRLTSGPMPTARGGILTGLAGIAANQLVDPIVREAVSGARVLSNDPYAHTPVNIKSLNGANYDISTEAGRSGYDKAKNSGGLSDMDQRALRLKNDERIAKIKAESDAVIKAGQDDINSVFYKSPTRDQSAPNGGDGNGTRTSPGGKPIVMDMAAADDLYKSRGLGSYRSGNKGFENAYNLDPQDSSKYFTNKLSGDFIPKSVAGDMKGYMDNISPTTFSSSRNGEIEGLSIKDAFTKPINLNTAGMSMSEALADTESMRGPITEEGKLQRARAAFLNANNSMDGLRAQERELDIIYAGGKHYVANDNGGFETNPDGTNAAADAEQIKQLKSGAITPQLFKEGFKADLINRHASKPSEAENPRAQAPETVPFRTERAVDFGSTDLLGSEFDEVMGARFNQSDLSNTNDAFNTDIDLTEYIPGSIRRTPTMR